MIYSKRLSSVSECNITLYAFTAASFSCPVRMISFLRCLAHYLAVFITIHRSLDWCHLFFLPTTDVIDLVTKYLESYFAEWVQNPGYRPWSKLRKGELRGFEALQDGTKYRYQLLSSPHFDLQLPIFVYRQQTHQVFNRPYTTFPEFESHVTPFAICVNTLRALEDWEHPREIQPIFRSRRMEHFAQIEQWTLLALLGLAKGVTPNVDPPGELLKRALAFRRFAEAFHELQQAYQGYKSNHQTQLQGHRRTTGSPEPSQHSTAEDHDPTSPTPPSRTKAKRLLLSIAGGSKSTVDKSKKATMRVLHSFFNRSASLTEADRVRDAYLTSVTRDFAIPQTVLGRR
ncbi:hypothetical protein BDP27DRAFT_322903 [Rhodocollybia butyracea]|uniref:Uncharacterized protein n=1 Tax=Rhodocollybia butyracea TaxID=206335 RepID=A0A9P5U0X2_9AGAR|nr:hypothetical protein BDP27DRAFT_322903 [Rhodocollybia butyracea]